LRERKDLAMKRFEELFAELQQKAARGDPASGTVRELAHVAADRAADGTRVPRRALASS
jgi:hypothetical protein